MSRRLLRPRLFGSRLIAASWIATIALISYFASRGFDSLAGYIEKASWVVSASLLTAGYAVWRRKKRKLREGDPKR